MIKTIEKQRSREKKGHRYGIFALTCLLILSFSIIFAVGVSAEEGGEVSSFDGSDKIGIFAANLKFFDDEEGVRVVYALNAELDAAELSTVGMLFFYDSEGGFEFASADYAVSNQYASYMDVTLGDTEHGETLTFSSREIAPERIGDLLYARPYYLDTEGNYYYGEVVKFGVLDYVYARYRDIEEGAIVTEEQKANYSRLLEWGAEAQIEKDYRADRLVSSHGIRLTAELGSFSDGFSYGTFLLGDEVTLTAKADKTLGGFIGWKGEDGTAVSYDDSYEITVTEEMTGGKLVAEYAGIADFDDLALGAVGGADSAVTSGGYKVYLGNSSTNFGAEIALDPTDPSNKVLKFTDANADFGGGLRMDVEGDGDFVVYSLDMYVESFTEGSTPLQFQFGPYMIQFTAMEDAALRIYDSNNKDAWYLDRYIRPSEWVNFKVMITNSKSADKSARAYLYINDTCLCESYNIGNDEMNSYVALYGLKASEVVAYVDNVSAYRRNVGESTENTFAPRRVFTEASSASNDRFQNAEILLGDGAADALREMDAELFSENIYLWIADLYDPETSALYFSISGRDSYGYLPDIETVAQGYGLLSTLGLGGNTVVLNDAQKANLTAWIQTLQSNRDGYYYHPHWGVSIGNSRLSRDLGNSSSSYSASGSLAFRLFDDANYRLSGGSSGSRGVTVETTYDNSLTGQLRSSVAYAVSKVILASESDNSSMPHHLRSEENLVRHITDQWNSSCKVGGTHERHFCDDNCVIVVDPSDSYMKIEDGELVITRGYRCTSCHVCSHSLGHSYSFGHHFTSMGSQVKSAGLGEPLVMYFRDIQENVQASLRDKAQASYIAENGQAAWNALADEEKAAIRKAAENGIWEEQVTYGTISGLLKISGIPSTHGYEFLYAEAAINSAIECALFTVEDFITTGQAVVSIYNPFNAINSIMNNINNYAADKSVRLRAREILRENAEELIRNTTGKLEGYLMPDGGFSYNYSGYCTHSQGQPVAIAGSREGDVNGTALVLGARSALLSCLGVSIPAPFGGNFANIEGGFDLNGDGDLDDGFDLDLDGTADAFEATCTHQQRFRYIITTKEEIKKVDTTGEKYTQTFDPGTLIPGNGEVITEGGNYVFKAVDNDSGGHSVTFNSANIITENFHSRITFDMKVISSNNTTSHQLFVDSSVLRLDFTYNNGYFTFSNVVNGKAKTLYNTAGKRLEIYAKEWFNMDVVLYREGKVLDGKTVYGVVTLTQNDNVQVSYLESLAGYSVPSAYRMYSLMGAENVVYYDNACAYNSVAAGVHDGEYHFDTTEQKIADENTLVPSPTFSYDTVYMLNSGKASFDAYDYSTNSVIYNFDSVQTGLLLSDAKVGDRVDLVLLDREGRAITGIYLIVGEGGKVSFFAANGQILTESIPRTEYYANGTSAIVSRERDMVIEPDLSDWMLIKLEYHHDMVSPQLDIVVKYSDLAKKGYKTTTAATLTGVDVIESGANPYLFDTLEFNASGRIYLDDLYIRNVFDGCSGEHEYIQKTTNSYYLGLDSYGHKEYYLSCRNCGFRGEETFVIHTYARVISDEFKLADASIYNAAIYAESCTVCGLHSGETFVYGLPLEDPNKYNFSGPEGDENEIPSTVSITTGGGKTATVMSEKVGEVVNYFLRVAKYKGSGSHSMTFKYQKKSGEALADKYVYEFDFRWISASDMLSGRGVILVKMGAGGAVVCPATYIANSTGNSVNYAGTNMYSGEWHSMRYLFVRNEADNGWVGTCFIDGEKNYGFTVEGNGVPYVDYETRWNLTEGGVIRYNNLELDIDRIRASASTQTGHSFEEIVDDRFLISEASCLSPAVYAKYCSVCGEFSAENTFTYGEKADHVYGNIASGELKVCDADCERAETYYRSCKTCGVKSSDTFTVGAPLGHDLTITIVKEATRTEPALARTECSRCDYSTEAAPYGDPLCYVFDEKKKLPNTVSVAGFRSEPLTEGLWACVLSENVNGAVNYYLNVQKYGATSTHNLTFKSGQAGKSTYIYEFDFRWHYAARMRGNCPIIVKMMLNGNQATAYSMAASADGSKVTYRDVTMNSGEWHTMRYEFTKTSNGWSYTVKVDGKTVELGSFAGSGIPIVLYETRWGQTQKVDKDGDGIAETEEIINCTDISFDIDNVYQEAK